MLRKIALAAAVIGALCMPLAVDITGACMVVVITGACIVAACIAVQCTITDTRTN